MMNVKKPISCPFLFLSSCICLYFQQTAGGDEVARERQGQRERRRTTHLPCFFFLSMLRQQGERGTKETERGQHRDSRGETVVFLTSSQQGGGWKRRQRTTRTLFLVRGSDTQLPSRFLPPKSSCYCFVLFFLFILLFYKQTCQSSMLRHGVPWVSALISCFLWQCHSLITG